MAFENFKSEKRILKNISRWLFTIVMIIVLSPEVKCQSNVSVNSFGEDINAKRFFSSAVDNNDLVWFLTDAGIINYNGTEWILYTQNINVNAEEIKDIDYATFEKNDELWIASSEGASVITNPFDSKSEVTTYSPENSNINNKNVISVVLSKKGTKWFATENGVSAFEGNKWLTNDYEDLYPTDLFDYFPISTMATSDSGDTLYVGTLGAGVMRFYKNDEVDAISGASEYAVWGPILMPSDNVHSVYIAADGTQWIGTDSGVAKHTGYNTLDNWTTLDSEDGLADNLVQAINSDTNGNMYFGTKNGLSIFDGTNWTTYKVEDGLISNNILTISINKNNVVWLGTDNGVTCIKDGEIISYQ